MNQTEQQLRLTIEALRERQEWELVNNREFGLLHNADHDQRIHTHSGPPTPDDMDELLSMRAVHEAVPGPPQGDRGVRPRVQQAAGCTSDAVDIDGHRIPAWRGVPIYPCGKIPIADGHTTSILAMRTGEDNQGVVGLHQTGIPDEYAPGLNVRFMGIDEKAVISYLVTPTTRRRAGAGRAGRAGERRRCPGHFVSAACAGGRFATRGDDQALCPDDGVAAPPARHEAAELAAALLADPRASAILSARTLLGGPRGSAPRRSGRFDLLRLIERSRPGTGAGTSPCCIRLPAVRDDPALGDLVNGAVRRLGRGDRPLPGQPRSRPGGQLRPPHHACPPRKQRPGSAARRRQVRTHRVGHRRRVLR